MHALTYDREPIHWTEFVRLAQSRAYGGWGRLAMFAAGAVPMLLAVLVATLSPGSLDVGSVLFGMLSSGLILRLATQIGVRRHVKDAGWVLGRREINLTEQGLRDAGNGTVLSVEWRAIEGVTVAKGIIVLWMDRAAGVFIPRTAFTSGDDERDFIDLVNTHVKRTDDALSEAIGPGVSATR